MWFFNRDTHSEQEKPPVKVPTCTTSEEITQELNPSDGGICSPAANIFTLHKLGHEPTDFTYDSPATIYQRCVAYREHQNEAKNQRKNHVSTAFEDAGVPYDVTAPEVSQVIFPEKLKKAVESGGGPHSILTYQVQSPRTTKTHRVFHTVALGRENKNNLDAKPTQNDNVDLDKCYYFDTNFPGFFRRDRCDNIYRLAAETLKRSLDPEAKKILISTDKSPENSAKPLQMPTLRSQLATEPVSKSIANRLYSHQESFKPFSLFTNAVSTFGSVFFKNTVDTFKESAVLSHTFE